MINYGMDGKVALITGAGGGIGRAAALAFAASGAAVLVSDVNAEGGDETVALIAAAGGKAAVQRCNVADGAEVKAMVAAAVSHFGRLDYAFNNAGINNMGLDEYEDEVWVVGLTRHGALRWAKAGIRVNAVCPGVIETPMTAPLTANPEMKKVLDGMTPMGRMGLADEIASAVVWLCSDAASFVTGHPLVIDGGATAV